MSSSHLSARRWRVVRACARCHRLKSKCIYETPDSCERCLKQKVLCSLYEDPTAKIAKKRPIEISATRVSQKIEKYIQALESEVQLLGTVSIDTSVAKLLNEQAKRVLDMSNKLAAFHGLVSLNIPSVRDTWQRDILPIMAQGVNDFSKSPVSTFLGNKIPNATDLNKNIMHQVVHKYQLLPESQARIRFTHFLYEMLPYFPIISLPETFKNYDSIYNEFPQLLLVCIYVTTFDYHGFCSEDENVKLNRSLAEIVDTLLTQNVFQNTSEFSYRSILTCIIISVWSVPSLESGQFRTHMEILSAANIALCIDAGNAQLFSQEAVFDDNSLERNDLRGFLCLYTCLANMGFCLPRFNLIPWSKRQDLAVDKLLRVKKNLPSKSDELLCLQARLVRVGQELVYQFAINGVGLQFLSSNEKPGESLLPTECFGEFKHMEYEKANEIIESYKERLFEILREAGHIDLNTLTVLEGASKQTYSVLQLYFQILIAAHDNLVSWSFCELSRGAIFSSTAFGKYLYKHINGFAESCKGLIRVFIETQKEAVTLPNPYHYRTVLALISLLRVLVLVKSDYVRMILENYPPIDFELVGLFAQVSQIFVRNSQTLKLIICDRIGDMLPRISKWIDKIQSRENGGLSKPDAKDEFFKLAKMSKGRELWMLHEQLADVNRVQSQGNFVPEIATHRVPPLMERVKGESLPFEEDTDKNRNIFVNSIHEIFKDVDDDFVRFFNPSDPIDLNN